MKAKIKIQRWFKDLLGIWYVTINGKTWGSIHDERGCPFGNSPDHALLIEGPEILE